MTRVKSSKTALLSCVLLGSIGAATMASAETGPIMVAVGNGTPLLGSSNSKVGVGVLTPKPNGPPVSVRVLGTEKTAGVYAAPIKGPNGQPTQAQVMTPIDGIVNSHLPR